LVKIFGVLVTLAGVGVLAMVLAPSVFGQERPERRSRELTVLAGRGAEIGVYVRDESAGVTVDEVRSDSAAEKAGLRANDVIVEFDGEHVRSARQFSRLVQETAVGRTVKTTILRDKQKKEIEITIPENHRADLFIDSDRFRDQLGDRGNGRIDVFDPKGRPLAMLGAPGVGDGQFKNIAYVAVAPDGTVLGLD